MFQAKLDSISRKLDDNSIEHWIELAQLGVRSGMIEEIGRSLTLEQVHNLTNLVQLNTTDIIFSQAAMDLLGLEPLPSDALPRWNGISEIFGCFYSSNGFPLVVRHKGSGIEMVYIPNGDYSSSGRHTLSPLSQNINFEGYFNENPVGMCYMAKDLLTVDKYNGLGNDLKLKKIRGIPGQYAQLSHSEAEQFAEKLGLSLSRVEQLAWAIDGGVIDRSYVTKTVSPFGLTDRLYGRQWVKEMASSESNTVFTPMAWEYLDMLERRYLYLNALTDADKPLVTRFCKQLSLPQNPPYKHYVGLDPREGRVTSVRPLLP